MKKLPRYKPVSFQALITDLRKKGWTQTRIAEECGTSQPTIQSLYVGRRWEPLYTVGAKIVRLHQAVCDD